MINFFYNFFFSFKKKEIFFKNFILFVINKEKAILGNINYIFCNDEYIFQINQKFLFQKNYTDILTFNYVDNNILSGDIFISIERIIDNSKTWKQPFSFELKRVMIHGILHLLGYNDETYSQKILMRKKENFYLNIKNV